MKVSHFKGKGGTPGINPLEARKKEPQKELKVPKKLIPPELPGETLLKLFRDKGAEGDKIPISVPQVSAVAAAKVTK